MHDSRASVLRIGMLTHSVNPRGGVVHALEMAEALTRRGHEVTLFAPSNGEPLFREATCLVELVPFEKSESGLFELVCKRAQSYVHYFNDRSGLRGFDVCHAQDGISGNALATMCQQGTRCSVVRTVHHLEKFSDPRVMALQERSFRHAARVLCVSRHWCDVMASEFDIAATQVDNGVDATRFQMQTTARDHDLATRLGIRPKAPVFLAVGGVESRKNTLRLLEAFIAVRGTWNDAQLVIAGGSSLLDHSDYQERFRSMLKQSGLPIGPGQAVVMTGVLEDIDMPSLYRLADMLVMPSFNEGFGLAVLEAIACGVPVAVSRIAPFTDYLCDYDCAWLDPDHAQSIAQAMLSIRDTAGWTRRTRSAKALCKRFNWDVSAQRHEEIYHHVRSQTCHQ